VIPPPPPAPPQPPRAPTPPLAAPPPPAPPRAARFDESALLRDLQRSRSTPAPAQPSTAPPSPQAAAPRSSNAPHNPTQPLSMTEEDAIRQRIVQNWNVDVGARGIETFVVTLRVWVAIDGSVTDARVIASEGDPADGLRAYAEGARRAALRSSPLPLPPARAQQLTGGNLELRFTARDMLGLRR
jgi:hypothetical protein